MADRSPSEEPRHGKATRSRPAARRYVQGGGLRRLGVETALSRCGPSDPEQDGACGHSTGPPEASRREEASPFFPLGSLSPALASVSSVGS